MRHLSFLFCLGATLATATAASAQQQDPSDPPRKQARALRVPGGSVNVDGRLDDPAWRDAVPLNDFPQREPDEGAPPDRRDGSPLRI